MSIETRVSGISNRAYGNACKAFMRDPSRPINLIIFSSQYERAKLVFTTLGDREYEAFLKRYNYV